MKSISITLCFCLCWLCTKAQPNYVWAKVMGGGVNTNLSASRLDAAGNIYITGEFRGTGIFGGASLTATGSSDIYVSKLDAAGNFIWTKQIGGNAIIRSHDIVLDRSGNIYLTGYFTGTVDFDPGTGIYNLSTNTPDPNPGSDIFICKLDNNGNFLWAGQMGGATQDYGNSIAVDTAGDVYITGSFTGTADFNPGTGAAEIFYLNTNDNRADAFICKLNAAGHFQWAYNLTEAGSGSGRSVCTDTSGYVYLTGEFTGTVDFDPGPGNTTFSSANQDGFIVKFTPAGGFLFARHTTNTGFHTARSIYVDKPGNIYTTGAFYGTSDFDPGPAAYTLTSTSINSDIFIAKLDTAGNFLWAKQIIDTNQETSTGGDDIITDRYGNVYLTGDFSGTCDFDPGTGIFNITSNGADDFFVLKLDAMGNFGWALAIGGTSGNQYDQGHSINMDQTGAIVVSGRFYGTVDFNPGPGIDHLTAPQGNYNHFLLKLKPCVGDTTYITHTACHSYAYNNQVYYQSGVYPHSFLDILGCDSIVILDLTIHPFNYSSGRDTLYVPCFALSYPLQPSATAVQSYLWEDSSSNDIRIVDSQGLYWVTYEMAGCTMQTDSFLVYFNIPELHVNNSCNELLTGKAWMTQQATDTNTYAYAWYNAARQIVAVSDSIVNQPSGNYTVHITSHAGCDTTISFTIAEEYYKVSFTADSISCEGAAVSFTNTSDPHFQSFEWQFGDSSFSVQPHPEHRYIRSKVYEVRLAGTGTVCGDTAYKTIIVDKRREGLQFDADRYAICTGEAIQFTPASGDSTLVALHWQLGDDPTLFTTDNSTVRHAYDEAGTYPVTLTTSFRACPDTSFSDTISVHPLPAASLGNDSVICLHGAPITLQNRYRHDEGYQYVWNTGATTSAIVVRQPGTYCLSIRNAFGCTAEESIRVAKDCYAAIPNAFTPNGDGVNDYFFPRQLLSQGVRSFRMQVFNRWGEKVFETFHTDGRGWDGKFGGKEQPAGVYVYWIDIELGNGSQERYEGNVTLIR